MAKQRLSQWDKSLHIQCLLSLAGTIEMSSLIGWVLAQPYIENRPWMLSRGAIVITCILYFSAVYGDCHQIVPGLHQISASCIRGVRSLPAASTSLRSQRRHTIVSGFLSLLLLMYLFSYNFFSVVKMAHWSVCPLSHLLLCAFIKEFNILAQTKWPTLRWNF